MTKKLVWRLGKLPTPSEVTDLVKDKIITQEEAREVLFSSEDEIDRDKKSLESEIKFLRELVENLSSGNSNRIVTIIKEIKVPYERQNWYQTYGTWCGALNGTTGNNTLYVSNTAQAGVMNGTMTGAGSFSNIKTF